MKRALLLAAAAFVAPALSAQTVAIVGGTVAIGDGSQPIREGVVLFHDGRIVAAGAGIPVPAGASVIDAHGKWVSAGIVGGWTTLGLAGESYSDSENDASAPKSPFSAAIDVSTAINANDMTISVDRVGGGMTRAIVAPRASASIFGGQGAVIDLGVGTPTLTASRAFQVVELGEDGAELAGGSRPAAYALLREALEEAGWDDTAIRGRSDARLTAADIEALKPVIQGKQRLVAHVERASDILQVLSLMKDFPRIRLVLLGASEGWLVAPQIAAARVPVISNAIENLPQRLEMLAASPSNVGRMTGAGINVAISTVDYGPLYRTTRQLAANLVATARRPGQTGLDWGQAFAAITSRPAQALGLDGEIGSLRPGRHADIVIWDGDPLEAESAPVAMYIDGKQQPLTNHLTELKDRYANPVPAALPKAYVR